MDLQHQGARSEMSCMTEKKNEIKINSPCIGTKWCPFGTHAIDLVFFYDFCINSLCGIHILVPHFRGYIIDLYMYNGVCKFSCLIHACSFVRSHKQKHPII